MLDAHRILRLYFQALCKKMVKTNETVVYSTLHGFSYVFERFQDFNDILNSLEDVTTWKEIHAFELDYNSTDSSLLL